MEFRLDETQQQLVRAVSTIVDRHDATPAAVSADPVHDVALEEALADSGYLDVATAGGSLLDAALVTERVARSSAVIPVGYRAVVAPLLGDAVSPPIALIDRPAGGVARFAATARDVVVVHGDEVTAFRREDCLVEPVGAAWGYPMARVVPNGAGRRLDASGEAVLERWRIALAAEAVGATGAAFDLTVAYVKDRTQFGRPIGSFQAVQHRLAELAVELEGARILTYFAAWSSPDPGAATAAATWALRTAKHAFYECHQLHGAIGFTNDYPLHLWSLRLKALGVEAGGFAAASSAAGSLSLGSFGTRSRVATVASGGSPESGEAAG